MNAKNPKSEDIQTNIAAFSLSFIMLNKPVKRDKMPEKIERIPSTGSIIVLASILSPKTIESAREINNNEMKVTAKHKDNFPSLVLGIIYI